MAPEQTNKKSPVLRTGPVLEIETGRRGWLRGAVGVVPADTLRPQRALLVALAVRSILHLPDLAHFPFEVRRRGLSVEF